MLDLLAHVEDLNKQYQGCLVSLSDGKGHQSDGYLNRITVQLVTYDYWFGDERQHLCVAWNISPVCVMENGHAFPSAHNDDFLNPTTIELVTNVNHLYNIRNV